MTDSRSPAPERRPGHGPPIPTHLLHAYFDRELDPAARLELEALLRGDRRAAAELERMHDAIDALRTPVPAADLTERVLAEWERRRHDAPAVPHGVPAPRATGATRSADPAADSDVLLKFTRPSRVARLGPWALAAGLGLAASAALVALVAPSLLGGPGGSNVATVPRQNAERSTAVAPAIAVRPPPERLVAPLRAGPITDFTSRLRGPGDAVARIEGGSGVTSIFDRSAIPPWHTGAAIAADPGGGRALARSAPMSMTVGRAEFPLVPSAASAPGVQFEFTWPANLRLPWPARPPVPASAPEAVTPAGGARP